jgi:hypothetical protein
MTATLLPAYATSENTSTCWYSTWAGGSAGEGTSLSVRAGEGFGYRDIPALAGLDGLLRRAMLHSRASLEGVWLWRDSARTLLGSEPDARDGVRFAAVTLR